MTPIEYLAAAPLFALITFIWAALQTEEVDGPKIYKQQNPDLWVETTTKVHKPKYPGLSQPVIPNEKPTLVKSDK